MQIFEIDLNHRFNDRLAVSLDFPLGSVDVEISAEGIHQIRIGTGRRPELTDALPNWLQPLVEFLRQWPDAPVPKNLPLVGKPTAWQLAVWERLIKIPGAETRSYGEIAREMGRPTAVRAVARACATNDWCLLIPCHRVLGANGAMVGFRWGIEWKAKLLRMEQLASSRG